MERAASDREVSLALTEIELGGEMDGAETARRITASDGSYRWFHDIGSVTERDEEGEPLKAAGIVIDITRQQR